MSFHFETDQELFDYVNENFDMCARCGAIVWREYLNFIGMIYKDEIEREEFVCDICYDEMEYL